MARPRYVEKIMEDGTTVHLADGFTDDAGCLAYAERQAQDCAREHEAALQGARPAGPLAMSVRAYIHAYPYVKVWIPLGTALLHLASITLPQAPEVHDYRTPTASAIRARTRRPQDRLRARDRFPATRV